ncbi:MAG: hypothetical protein COV29_02230 [Candidatus Yanofskybacteria bacterium CG10_big_fil_rev_8_21_14_0_10_36_16]|uniref:Gfo/Idh/MocA-like oxidoreductase N-terminal domain-containing protein n=1 Tax=Candidatus Yanofskybacteria bacterium CG10_big_fil_rev_8_21_14_0_10_36_16 TaxID=1975096 RepID=A0A2J0QBA0_9BACT|nr:MAG: hypothetical protein COV29_02230 [Candidatus Yanofskybacteria bacterium CG10_big_fil_rev_8_21_14_0_10_36_16]
MKNKTKIAIIGIGRWGKNLAREFGKNADIKAFCHTEKNENIDWLNKNFPKIPSKNYDSILKDEDIEAVIIATPINTHHKLAKQALLAGKHVFVEKPISETVKQAEELTRLASKKQLILFVGHIFSYHPILAKVKSITKREKIKKAIFSWHKLGTFKEDLVLNLGSHDIAIALELFKKPTNIKITKKIKSVTRCDIINLDLKFKGNTTCSIYLNRISNQKNKTATFIADKNVYLWENNSLFKLNKTKNEFSLIFESKTTPLEIEVKEFINCIQNKKTPLTNGEFGTEVVKVLEKIKHQ